MNKKLHIKKGDLVKVLAGNSKNKTGRVLEVLVDEDMAIVEGVNMITKAIKPDANNAQGGHSKKEGKIHISNLNVICPDTKKATRVGRRLSDTASKDGKIRLVRYSKKSETKKEIL